VQYYVRSEAVVSRVIAGETLIVPIRKGVGDLASIYSLNEAGSSIWQAISERRSRREIVEVLEREFEAGRIEIERDVDLFLSEMTAAGLVTTGACE
jgi:Coenzyme PQQ synthesis protein D (PqqD)